MNIDIDAGAADVLAEQAGRVGILERLFEMLERFVVEFTTQVVVCNRRAGGVAGDRQSFDHGMRIEAQDVAILAGTRLGLVGVAKDVFLPWRIARHERPLQTGREAGTTTTAQRTVLQFVDDRDRVGLLGKDLLPGLVAVDLEVIVERPRLLEMQRGVDDLVIFCSGSECHYGLFVFWSGSGSNRAAPCIHRKGIAAAAASRGSISVHRGSCRAWRYRDVRDNGR